MPRAETTGGSPSIVALIIGATGGVLMWGLCMHQFPHVPAAIPFYLTAFAFLFGSGAFAIEPFAETMTAPERMALALALGLVVAPTVLAALAVLDAAALFAPCAFIACGVAIVRWIRRPVRPASAQEWVASLVLPLLAFAVTAWISSQRMRIENGAVSLFGDYDTFDLTFLAGVGSELAHTTTFPPLSPFYAGHRIVYSYSPLIFLADVQRTTGASMLQVFLWFGWPLFTGLTASTMFVMCRRLGSVAFAATATAILLWGSGLAYLPALLRPRTAQMDPVIWSSMFLAPSAEWLSFNPWAPALVVVCLGVYALTRLTEPRGWWWGGIAAFSFGSLFMFKSFAFVVACAALGVASVVAFLRKRLEWQRWAAVACGAAACALPWLMVILPNNGQENRGAVISVESLTLVRRMLFKMDLTAPFTEFVDAHLGPDPHAWILLGLASLFFLIGGMGARLIGIAGVMRAAVGQRAMIEWTPLAWMVVVGTALPFFINIAPFPNSIQPYMFALFLMAPFAARAVWPPTATVSVGRMAATAALILASVPATVGYATAVHRAAAGPALTGLGAGEDRIVAALRRTDRSTTTLLHSNPLWPSLYAAEAGRRVVLAWSSYVGGDGSAEVDALSADIARFFGTPETPGVDDDSLLRRYRVTHVIERVATDRIHPSVLKQLRLVTGTPDVRLYQVPTGLRR